MLIVTLILFGLAVAVGLFCSVWMLVLAFQRHVLWGLSVLLVPFANLVFLVVAWEEAKRPFLWSFLALFLAGAGLATMPKSDPNGPLASLLKAHEEAQAGQARPAVAKPAIFKAHAEAELKIRLIALRQKEADLLERKAALDPKDRAGAVALTEEIRKYNEELNPILEQLRRNSTEVTSL